MVNSAPNKFRRVLGLAELWVAEIQLRTSAIWKLALGIGFEKTPHIKILDAIRAVEVMERAALAQCNRKQSIAIETAGFWLTLKQIGAIFCGNLLNTLKVFPCKQFV